MVLAWKFQNIMMHPGSRALTDISMKHLCNFPVTKEDIKAAEDIFGPNLGSHKGKMVHHPNPHVLTAK